ncbi:uncharacterized protein CLUP02_11668 [Colletotrichum lupini]|uniref:Uncharacterized protein n=1 Tax=Colletotrichum lupini TaxID=145971 RepID=A0A9Q8WJP7_9PEZI|nr:uncharacterized protein CLUP02_11668 [Colletotrichum lupini]UQC86168.1 hypothetical protein CLUP02_11668 [Colletotrichum lupini]
MEAFSFHVNWLIDRQEESHRTGILADIQCCFSLDRNLCDVIDGCLPEPLRAILPCYVATNAADNNSLRGASPICIMQSEALIGDFLSSTTAKPFYSIPRPFSHQVRISSLHSSTSDHVRHTLIDSPSTWSSSKHILFAFLGICEMRELVECNQVFKEDQTCDWQVGESIDFRICLQSKRVQLPLPILLSYSVIRICGKTKTIKNASPLAFVKSTESCHLSARPAQIASRQLDDILRKARWTWTSEMCFLIIARSHAFTHAGLSKPLRLNDARHISGAHDKIQVDFDNFLLSLYRALTPATFDNLLAVDTKSLVSNSSFPKPKTVHQEMESDHEALDCSRRHAVIQIERAAAVGPASAAFGKAMLHQHVAARTDVPRSSSRYRRRPGPAVCGANSWLDSSTAQRSTDSGIALGDLQPGLFTESSFGPYCVTGVFPVKLCQVEMALGLRDTLPSGQLKDLKQRIIGGSVVEIAFSGLCGRIFVAVGSFTPRKTFTCVIRPLQTHVSCPDEPHRILKNVPG